MIGAFHNIGGADQLIFADVSDFQLRRANPHARVLSTLAMPDNQWSQSSYFISYGGHPYLVQYGETRPNGLSAVPANSTIYGTVGPQMAAGYIAGYRCGLLDLNWSSIRIIDIGDIRNPRIVTKFGLEVDDPKNCPLVINDFTNTTSMSSFLQLIAAVEVYDVHHCSVDRLHDPTILACSQFLSGTVVYDIRDPFHPKELAYFDPGTLSATNPEADFTVDRPQVLADRGLIISGGFHHGITLLKFEPGVYPFANTLSCPSTYDWFFAQYNPSTNNRCPAVPVANSGSVAEGVPNTSANQRLPLQGIALILVISGTGPLLSRRRTRKQKL